MYSHTKKVGSLGRYGPRLGRKVRHEARKVEDETRRSRNCPVCNKKRLKRVSAGIWHCRSCGVKFTGGTHMPSPTRKAVEIEE